MPHPYSAFSSRTARIRRTAASPLLTTAIRLGNVTVDRSDTRSVYDHDRGQGPNRWRRCRPILTPKQVASPVVYRDAEVDPLIAAFSSLGLLETAAINEAAELRGHAVGKLQRHKMRGGEFNVLTPWCLRAGRAHSFGRRDRVPRP